MIIIIRREWWQVEEFDWLDELLDFSKGHQIYHCNAGDIVIEVYPTDLDLDFLYELMKKRKKAILFFQKAFLDVDKKEIKVDEELKKMAFLVIKRLQEVEMVVLIQQDTVLIKVPQGVVKIELKSKKNTKCNQLFFSCN